MSLLDKLELELGDVDATLRPALGTSSLHDEGPGQPQARDREQLVEDAAQHPALPPAAGPTEGEARADVDVDGAIEAARARGAGAGVTATTFDPFPPPHDPLADLTRIP